VVDDLGIYYDATTASRIEALISGVHDDAALQRSRALQRRWRDARLSKYNHAREVAPPLPGEYVLVVDQTFGDASIGHGLADVGSFRDMLQAALDEHPGLPLLLKVHPDVIAGRKRGHFETMNAGAASRVCLLAAEAHAPGLLERAAAVYVVTSQLGFEALLWQRPVRCFGMPFYAGWGLTRDALAPPDRRAGDGAVTLDALVDAALVQYPRYLDPETQRRCEVERLIDHLELQRGMRSRFAPEAHAIGFSRWKKPIARAFFSGSELRFMRRAPAAPRSAPVVVWGAKPAPDARAALRVEDGFIRSVGLGADLTRPLSWVQDDLGIYFDATKPSRLEVLLQDSVFTPALLRRACALRESIVAAGVTKYNVGAAAWAPPPRGDGRRFVLVPGQVESDASIALGAADIRSNLELLRAARAARPAAHLIYKPHPDVLAGLRGSRAQARRTLEACRAHCDEIVTDVPMGRLLDAMDEVHTLTSLAGFEALLRGKAVVSWGLPFYAGWGLTEDRAPASSPALQRRTRRLSLDELVAATLILYPAYVSRASGAFTTPERALHELVAWQRSGVHDAAASPWHRVKRVALMVSARLRGL